MELDDIENNTILAEKDLADKDLAVEKKKKGRPKKSISSEEIEFKKRVQEETDKAYKQVLEDRVNKDLKKKMRAEALANKEVFVDPELHDKERPKRVLSQKQLENLALGRQRAIDKQKEKGAISKKINEEVKAIQNSKRVIKKTLLVDKIREQVDSLDSDEDEEEIIIQKKPKVKKFIPPPIEEEVIQTPIKPLPKITFY